MRHKPDQSEPLAFFQEATLKKIEIFTDGACVPNPGKGGWAAILRSGNSFKEIAGSEENSTNNRMEFMAAAMALECLKEPCEITLYTDSMTLIYLLRSSGKKAEKRANQDLVQRILKALHSHKIIPVWVKGHNGHVENERCDELAMAAIRGVDWE